MCTLSHSNAVTTERIFAFLWVTSVAELLVATVPRPSRAKKSSLQEVTHPRFYLDHPHRESSCSIAHLDPVLAHLIFECGSLQSWKNAGNGFHAHHKANLLSLPARSFEPLLIVPGNGTSHFLPHVMYVCLGHYHDSRDCKRPRLDSRGYGR